MADVKTDNKDKKSKLFTAAIIVILCVVFVVGFIWGLNSVLAMEGSYPPETDTHGILTEPKSNEEVLNVLNNAVESAVEGKPKTVTSDCIDADIDDAETDGSDQFKSTLKFIKDNFEDTINENFEDVETDFAENLQIRVPQITVDDIESFECKYFARNYVYKCDICDAESDELLNGCPECGSGNLYVEESKGEYEIKIILKNDAEILNRNFAPRRNEEIKALAGENADSTGVLLENLNVNYDNLTISFRINRETGELTYLEYGKEMTVNATLGFADTFESLGKANVQFTACEKVKNEFTWPSLKLSEDEMVIEPKGSDNLTATLTCSDPTKPVVTWTSSDENVVTIDDEGYMKAGKEPGTATVTATFDFLGKTYTDSCEVSVRVAVESMSISKRSIKLSTGETKQLSTKVSPSDSTVKTATWYTEDESIATVDANGVVTAVAPGTVTVYALSDDGWYKSSCEVTVK